MRSSVFSLSRLEVGSSARIMSKLFLRALITAFVCTEWLLHLGVPPDGDDRGARILYRIP